ncbi:MAG: response regulator [Actinomycetota bacterium]
MAAVVAEASDGDEAIDVAREAMPEVILMDLSMPTVRGADETPHVKIVVLAASGEEADVLEAVKNGAGGYLLKSSTARRSRTPCARSGCSPRPSRGSCSRSSVGPLPRSNPRPGSAGSRPGRTRY